jgi:hypothetical protein
VPEPETVPESKTTAEIAMIETSVTREIHVTAMVPVLCVRNGRQSDDGGGDGESDELLHRNTPRPESVGRSGRADRLAAAAAPKSLSPR